MTDIPAIQISNLEVVYNENTSFEVIPFKNFSLTIKRGEILVITGGNGTGKSTLLSAISGTIPVKSGKIMINGIDVTQWSVNRRAEILGVVYQDTMLGTCPNLTLLENFQLTNRKKWWSLFPYEFKLNANQIMNIQSAGLFLENRQTTKIHMLSGGQRQVIAVCLAFENKKPILLFDEFTSALDEETKSNILKYTFEQAKKNDTTVIMVMHNMTDISKYVNNFLVL